MHAHAHFNLLLHDDDELQSLLGAEVTARQTLHQWPLSCVQRLDLADGRTYAYKSQRPPTVEGQFYESARSDLLPRARTIYQGGEYLCTLMDWIDAPLAQDLRLSVSEVVALGRDLADQISRIEGQLPYVLDISSETRWDRAVADTQNEWCGLIQAGKFEHTDPDTVQRIGEAAHSDLVFRAIGGKSGYVHGDLAGDNVFVRPEGLCVIDWQRPILGPSDLHLVTLLHSLGHDPAEYLAPGIVWVQYFLWARWLVRCKGRWFPAGRSYDRQVRDLVICMADLTVAR